MSVVEGGPTTTNLIQRVQNILLKPAAEWDVIAGEAATTRGLFVGYACILAAIPAAAGLIGGQVFGVGAFGFSYHPPLIGAVVSAVLAYVLALAAVFVMALTFDALAPSFGSEKNQTQALKVAIYSSTAGWVAGILSIIPMLGALAVIGGIYGLYIMWLGLPKLMKTPEDKKAGYFVVSLVVAVVVSIVIGAVVSSVGGLAIMGGGAMHVGSASAPGGTLSIGGNSVDLGKLQVAASQAEASAKGMQEGKGASAVDPEKLKALLPVSVAGLPRTEISSNSMGASGMGASNAEAVYEKDNNRITVTVTDMAAAQGLAAMAGAMNVNSSKETATGYEKVSNVNGRMTTEEWDRSSKNGKFGVIVANRFSVEASGTAGSIDDLKSAVAAVGPDRLEGLVHG